MTTATPPADNSYHANLLQVADPLASVLHIFDRFNHRHRNQHRVAKWWVQFALLRRALRRLDNALLAHQRRLRASSLARPAPSKSTRPRRVPTAVEASESAIAAHVQWLTAHAVPPAYIAFTQLAADGQHAPLGLLLVALTARLDAVLALLNPTPAAPLQSQPEQEHKSSLQQLGVGVPPAQHPDHLDLGVAVSRSSVRPDSNKDDSEDDDEEETVSRPTLDKQETTPRRTPSTSEAVPDTISKTKLKPKPKLKAKVLPSKPPKKKKPKGDEFADLFSSLL
ncbi:hypothetical protein ACHAQA_001110 [Verticillium albo-atrum]